MKYINRFEHENELNVQEGDKVEIILRSSLYCIDDEEPIYHSGAISEVAFEEFEDGTYPVGIYVKFDEDSLYEEQEEELVSFSEMEDVFIKKYDIAGYAMLNEGVTLSVKGAGIDKIIWFSYHDGSLIPESISEGGDYSKRTVTKEDKAFIQEVKKYGTSQQFFHYVLSKSQ